MPTSKIRTNCAFVLDEREKRMEHTFKMCYVLASQVSIVPYSSGGAGCWVEQDAYNSGVRPCPSIIKLGL